MKKIENHEIENVLWQETLKTFYFPIFMIIVHPKYFIFEEQR